MIKKPKHGWCSFALGNFNGNASYLTDVPVDLLNAFIDYFERGNGVAVLDEEGSSFTLIMTQYNCNIYIIEERESLVLHDLSDYDIRELAEELINDIELDINNWAHFIVEESESETRQHRELIFKKVEKLRENLQE